MQETVRPGPVPRQRRILIVDDHALVRRALTALIDSDPEFSVCGEAATQAEALAAITAMQPDLVITELSFDAVQGLSLVHEIGLRHPGLPVLVVSLHDEGQYGVQAAAAGARGYVAKHELGEALLGAIRQALDGPPGAAPA